MVKEMKVNMYDHHILNHIVGQMD